MVCYIAVFSIRNRHIAAISMHSVLLITSLFVIGCLVLVTSFFVISSLTLLKGVAAADYMCYRCQSHHACTDYHSISPRFLITEMRKYHLVCTGIEQCLLLPAFRVCVFEEVKMGA